MVEDLNESFGSFAETITALGTLTKLETAISAAIKSSKVPPKETRKLLKCTNIPQATNTPVFQFIQQLFGQIGLGHPDFADMEIFKYTLKIVENPVCKIYSGVKDRKTCYVTADALQQFFTKCLDLPCTVEEIKCCNKGSEVCTFEINIQPLAVYQIALDEADKEIIKHLMEEDDIGISELGEKLEMEDMEIEYRFDILKNYHILDEENKVTEVGTTYYKYGHGLLGEKEDFDPPWRDMADISSAISASTSFAEAMSETTEKEERFEEVNESDVVNLAEEAKKSKSFAELLAKQVKKEEE